jgi:putative MATE family efflux protein
MIKPLAPPMELPGTLRRRVLLLALPAVGEQVLNTLVGLSDTFLVGHLNSAAASRLGYNSADALAGVGLSNQIVWVITTLFMAVSVGCTALIARAVGARDQQRADQVLRQSLLIGLAMGALASVLGLLLAAPAMQMLGADPQVLPLGVSFLHIVSLTFVPAALLFIGTAALRGAGDTRTPLYVMLGVNAVNILLSWLLVNGNYGAPVLGVAGAAVGAAVARGGGGLVLIGLLLRGRSGLKLSSDLRPDIGLLRRIMQVGAPSAGEQLVFQGALLIFIRFITGLGTVAYAAHNVVVSIESISFLPGMGYAIAASALVGQSLGAQGPDEAAASTNEALRQGGLMMTVLGVIMALFPQQLIGLFVSDPAVAQAGAPIMMIAGLIQPLLATNFIFSGGLRGAGDTSWPLYIKLISTWGVRLPLVLLLSGLGMGLMGIWLAMTADFVVQALLAFRRFQAGRWKLLRV